MGGRVSGLRIAEDRPRVSPATRQKCGTEFVPRAGLLFISSSSFFSLSTANSPHASRADPGSRLQESQSSGNDGLRGEEERQKRDVYCEGIYAYNAIYSLPSLSAEASSPFPPVRSPFFPAEGEKRSPLFHRFFPARVMLRFSSLFSSSSLSCSSSSNSLSFSSFLERIRGIYQRGVSPP